MIMIMIEIMILTIMIMMNNDNNITYISARYNPQGNQGQVFLTSTNLT